MKRLLFILLVLLSTITFSQKWNGVTITKWNGVALTKLNGVNMVTGAGGWTLASASYDSKSFSVSSQETTSFGLAFKSDGTKMYVAGYSKYVSEYALSTAWDVSTASYTDNVDISGQETYPFGLTFSDNGTKMFISGYSGKISEYALSTAWDASTASYTRNLDVSARDTPYSPRFLDSGTKLYFSGVTNDKVYQYALSTGYDLSTASYVRDFSISDKEGNAYGLFFNPDGTKMFFSGYTGDKVYEYALSTGYDISTASFTRDFSIVSQDNQSTGLAFKSDGTKMYVLGIQTDAVYQYLTP